MRAKLILCGLCVFFLGCVNLRDYFCNRRGVVGIELKREFGAGDKTKKNYYLTDTGAYFTARDTKKEVLAQMGNPDKIEVTVEGYEFWIYQDHSLRIFFSDDRVKEWDTF